MSTGLVRRFGTDVSNLPSDGNQFKTPKKASSQSTLNGFESAKVFTPSTKKVDTFSVQVNQFIPVDDEIFLASPQKNSNDYCRYERDFLLGFQQYCNEPIDGLIAEVLPGFISEEMKSSPTRASYSSPPKFGIRKAHSTEDQLPTGVVFVPTSKVSSTPSSKSDSHTPSKFSTPSRKELSVEIPPVSFDERSAVLFSPSSPYAPSGDATSPVSPTTITMEWRAKKSPKKLKPKESDARRLAARQKQIDIGINTPGYKTFLESVPAHLRTKEHPRIPDIYQICSKRSWDGQVRKWRRQLHQYDPLELAGQTNDDCDEIEDLNEDLLSDHEEYSSGCEDDQRETVEHSV